MKISWLTEPAVRTAGGDARVPTRLVYDPRDPYAVVLRFLPAGRVVTWLVSRELLRDGLSRPVGQGDVKVTPGGITVGVDLSSPFGWAQAVFARDDIAGFLRSTYITVPDGTESDHIDWSGIGEVLAG